MYPWICSGFSSRPMCTRGLAEVRGKVSRSSRNTCDLLVHDPSVPAVVPDPAPECTRGAGDCSVAQLSDLARSVPAGKSGLRASWKREVFLSASSEQTDSTSGALLPSYTPEEWGRLRWQRRSRRRLRARR